MKTPISYYGGKQTLARRIISLIPHKVIDNAIHFEHNLYNEPFIGGGAVFWLKPASSVEVINDIDGRIVNFYQMCQSNFDALKKMIVETPHSRHLHQESHHVLRNPDHYSKLRLAWAVWVQTNMSFGSCMFAGYGYSRKRNSCEKKLMNKRLTFSDDYSKRLECVQIECSDAIKVIQSRDYDEAFHYCDPPYFNAHMGHYGGYKESNMIELLDTLTQVKGKFLLSSYDSAILEKYVKKCRWKTIKISMNLSMVTKSSKRKIEVLTANYSLN